MESAPAAHPEERQFARSRRVMSESSRRTGRAIWVRDHQRLEGVFMELLESFQSGDRTKLRAIWARFDDGLRAHMAAEESYLLPYFAQADLGEATALLVEHARFRRALDELGVGLDLHLVKLDAAEELIAMLREHAHREEDLLYVWAEGRSLEPYRGGWRATVRSGHPC